jgi:AAA15 family ATPase/GTPase
MQLKYIWIKEYKNLKEIGFNLNSGADETFEYIDGKLKIKKKEISLPADFYSKNIKGITAIVGKNGSGKTNFSEFLNYNLAHARNGGLSTYIHSQGMIVLEDKIFIQKDLSLLNESELEHKGYQILKFKDAPLDKGNGEFHWYKMEKNKYIYYNPNFDFRILEMRSGSDNIINISTNYLVSNDVYNSPKHKLADTHTYSYRVERGTDKLSAFYINEKMREAELILNYPNINKLIARMPTDLAISIDHKTENNLLNLSLFEYEDESEIALGRKSNAEFLSETENHILNNYFYKKFEIKKLEDRTSNLYSVPHQEHIEAFKILFLTSFFRIYLLQNKISFEIDFLQKYIYEDQDDFKDVNDADKLVELKQVLTELLDHIIWDESTREVSDGSYGSYLKQEYEIFNLFGNIKLDNSKTQLNLIFRKLISKTKNLLNGELNFHYQFSHRLSSGEQNLLNFYSRFYWAKQRIIQSEKDQYGVKGDRIVIFLDEGEIALHPEWQRRYFGLAIDFLSNLFEDRDIQLILTTHSPFVLSDIPKEHIIFLKKDKNTGSAKIANVERDKTFGANIYTLLSDSFFMEEGTIGDFAKQKIEEALRILIESPKLSDEYNNKVKTIIDLIGEPLIKMQLERLFNDKLEEPLIKKMQKRIDELEANQNKRKDD